MGYEIQQESKSFHFFAVIHIQKLFLMITFKDIYVFAPSLSNNNAILIATVNTLSKTGNK